MKTKLIAQEILINHNSKYFNNQFEKQRGEYINPDSTCELFADACQQGFLFEIIPEICTQLPLKEINATGSFLVLKYGDYINSIEKPRSINPYLFFQNKIEN